MTFERQQIVASAILGAFLQLSGTSALAVSSQAVIEPVGDPMPASVALAMHAPLSENDAAAPSGLESAPESDKPSITKLGFSHLLQATVSTTCYEHELTCQIQNSLLTALNRDQEAIALREASIKYAKVGSLVKNRSKDAVVTILDTGGFGPSKEAARIMLDKQKKNYDSASTELMLQKAIDRLHPKIVESVLEIAMGVGDLDPTRGKEIMQKGYQSLVALTGEEQAAVVMKVLQNWNQELQSRPNYKAKSWDIHTFQRNVSCATEAAMVADPVISGLTQRLERFRKPGAAKENVARVLQTAFSAVTWLGPGIGIPAAAECARLLVVACTGGSEEDKMIKELYIDKRLQSRCDAITGEMQMSMTSYQMGVLQTNSILSHCSRAIINELVSDASLSAEIRRRENNQSNGREEAAVKTASSGSLQ